MYRAAQAEMRRLLGGAKLPKMDVLKEEGRKLTAKKKQLYGEYQKARRDMQEIVTIKANIDTLLGYTEPGRKQEKERWDYENKEQSDADTSGHVGPKIRVWGKPQQAAFVPLVATEALLAT